MAYIITMNPTLALMAHVLFGVLCLLIAVWLLAETLYISEANIKRVRSLSKILSLTLWIGYLSAAYFYILHYAPDKAIILKGPWPFAHNIFMEVKEHVVIMLLLLVSYLPIAAKSDLVQNADARKLFITVLSLIAFIAFFADGFGGVIGMGVKMGLLAK